MVDFASAAATAKRLIEANGRTVTLLKLNRTEADPTKPWRGPDTDADPSAAGEGGKLVVKAAFVPARGTGFGRDINASPNPLLSDVEQFALIAAASLPTGTDLEDFDLMRDRSKLWRIIFAGLLAPADTDVVWEVGVGR